MKTRSLLKLTLAVSLACATASFAKKSTPTKPAPKTTEVKKAPKTTTVKGNPKSKIYHLPTCRHYKSKHTTVVFKSEAEAQKAGYRICKKCSKAKAAKKKAKKAKKAKQKTK
jgi:hypothetical protein